MSVRMCVLVVGRGERAAKQWRGLYCVCVCVFFSSSVLM